MGSQEDRNVQDDNDKREKQGNQPAWEQLTLFDMHPTCDEDADTPTDKTRTGVGSVGDLASFYDDKILRSSGWIWLIHPERVVGICPDCGLGVQVKTRPTSERTVQLVDEAETLHRDCGHVLAPTLLLELYGVDRIARRFGFPDELLPERRESA